jgi:hypothetical protein
MSFAAGSALLFAQYLFFIQQPQQLEKQAMSTSSQAERERVRFKLASGTLEVDRSMLESMKLALLSFFKKPEAEFPTQYLEGRDYLRQELERAACWISGDSARIGAWRLENRDGRLELLRYPPPINDDMYIFHATLERKDSEWKVIAFELEREFGPN